MISPHVMKRFEYEIPAATTTFIRRAKHARSPLVATEDAGKHASQPGLLGVTIILEAPDFLR